MRCWTIGERCSFQLLDRQLRRMKASGFLQHRILLPLEVAARGFPGRFSIASLGWCYLNCHLQTCGTSADMFMLQHWEKKWLIGQRLLHV
ncbi:unnamed protein product [Durusdinium trenchii]|uniref:Uncharacterized protein n=1 Tax=Durusdinium trenchii TaxID=1381693 RepID=A0ABP0N9F8_9DINO